MSAANDKKTPEKAVDRISVSIGSLASGLSGEIPKQEVPAREELARKEKKKKFSWKSFTYTTRVTLAFAFIAAMTALVAIGVVSFVWEQHFRTYTTDNMQSVANNTAERIAEIYERTESLWNIETTRPAVQASEMTSGVGVKVIDVDGGVPFDSSIVISEDGSILESFEPKDPSQVARASIVVDDKVVGSVRVWVYGSDTFMRAPDQEFRNNSYQAMMLASVVAIVLA